MESHLLDLGGKREEITIIKLDIKEMWQLMPQNQWDNNEQLYANELENPEDVNKFLETHNLLRWVMKK